MNNLGTIPGPERQNMRLVVLVVCLQHGGVANSHLVLCGDIPLTFFLCNYFLEKVQAIPSRTHNAYCPIAQNIRPKAVTSNARAAVHM